MGVTLLGNGGTAVEVDGTTHRALRVTSRPLEHGSLGHYSASSLSGVIAAALGANSEVYQFRWSDATRLCVVRRVKMSAVVSTTMFAAGVPLQFRMDKCSGWSVAGSGGNRIIPGTDLKRRASMGSSLVAANDIGISSTAALTAGTKTIETNPIAGLVAAGPITGSLNGTIIPPGTILFEAEVGDGGHPLVLAQNEGFIIRSVAVPATGTWTLQVESVWAEVAAY